MQNQESDDEHKRRCRASYTQADTAGKRAMLDKVMGRMAGTISTYSRMLQPATNRGDGVVRVLRVE